MGSATAVGGRLKTALATRGLNANELAKLAKVNASGLYKAMKGKADLAAETLDRIAPALNVTTEWLLTGKGENGAPEATEPAEGQVAEGIKEEVAVQPKRRKRRTIAGAFKGEAIAVIGACAVVPIKGRPLFLELIQALAQMHDGRLRLFRDLIEELK